MRSLRHRAGSRRNKHHPNARQTRISDYTTGQHGEVGGWAGPYPGQCGIECACGVTFDGFDTLAQAHELLDLHIASYRKPNHAARAVSIDACFPLADPLLGTRPAHPGKETKTEPMGYGHRIGAYRNQNGAGRHLTDRQERRLEKKWRRANLRPTAA